MSAEIAASTYADFLAGAYLGSFVADGGAAVKVAVAPSVEDAEVLTARAVGAAREKGYIAVRVDAATTRVSLIQHIFFAVAGEVDWSATARKIVRHIAKERLGFAIDGSPTYEAIGAVAGLDAAIVRREMLKGLQSDVYRNYALAKDFRLAMMQYCNAELEGGAGADHVRQILGEWLRGELRLVSSLKEWAIFQKIGRHNARVMMASTAHWLRQAGHSGLVVVLDLGRLAAASRQDAQDDGYHYTVSAVMDAYEVLRQFIDSTDEMSAFLLLVIAPQALLNDDRRGFQAYAALQNRVWDDVRDRTRANPFAPMVRIAAGGES
ncbi:MAG: DUF2791 family P-loop domain-containing protein [Pseudomonadota bacterium]|jgi:hypothetical protein|nr:DUF2791 family P-loop domain-containing protein [Pseudomonadota bacterium]